MVTDKDARALVEHLHMLASHNREIVHPLPVYDCWRRCCETRAGAYDLAAERLEKIITDETNEETRQ